MQLNHSVVTKDPEIANIHECLRLPLPPAGSCILCKFIKTAHLLWHLTRRFVFEMFAFLNGLTAECLAAHHCTIPEVSLGFYVFTAQWTLLPLSRPGPSELGQNSDRKYELLAK